MRTTGSFWARPRGLLVLGAAACAACCAAPLVAIVIGAGAASSIAAVAEPIAGLLLAAAAVLGIAIYVRRRRARSCGCSTAGRTQDSPPQPGHDVKARDAGKAFTADPTR